MIEKQVKRRQREEIKSQKLKEEQDEAEIVDQREQERERAAAELTLEFAKANESMNSDADSADESAAQQDGSSLLMNELEGEIGNAKMQDIHGRKASIFMPNNDLGFYSDGEKDEEQSFPQH